MAARKRRTRAVMLCALLYLLPAEPQAQGPRVEIEGLLKDAAVLRVDGERKLLRVGQSLRGVTLVAAQADSATVEINGERTVLGLSQHIGTQYETAAGSAISIPRTADMQYRTTALINGRSVPVLVDTGATSVALSTAHAKALGVDYLRGRLTQAHTASGVAQARMVKLNSVSVGGIQVDNVEAAVIDGTHPTTVLLGMTYLRHVSMQESNGILTLSRGH